MNNRTTPKTGDRSTPRSWRMALLWAAFPMSIVFATVLMANDYNNLRLLLEKVGIHYPEKARAKDMESADKADLSRRKIKLHRDYFRPIETATLSDFDRSNTFNAATLCDIIEAISGSGYLGYTESPVARGQKECMATIAEKTDEPGVTRQSLFFQVRAHENGNAIALRIKILSSTGPKSEKFRRMFQSTVETIIERLNWLDLLDDVSGVVKLQPFKIERYGLSFRLTQEIMDPSAYNFIIDRQIRAAPQKRAKRYFDSGDWLEADDMEDYVTVSHKCNRIQNVKRFPFPARCHWSRKRETRI